MWPGDRGPIVVGLLGRRERPGRRAEGSRPAAVEPEVMGRRPRRPRPRPDRMDREWAIRRLRGHHFRTGVHHDHSRDCRSRAGFHRRAVKVRCRCSFDRWWRCARCRARGRSACRSTTRRARAAPGAAPAVPSAAILQRCVPRHLPCPPKAPDTGKEVVGVGRAAAVRAAPIASWARSPRNMNPRPDRSAAVADSS